MELDQCPGEELSICCTYELTRSSTLIRETTEPRRDGEQDRLTQAVILVFLINATWVPGFPLWSREPYLAIPAAERKSSSAPSVFAARARIRRAWLLWSILSRTCRRWRLADHRLFARARVEKKSRFRKADPP
jgi:hypothetical protein